MESDVPDTDPAPMSHRLGKLRTRAPIAENRQIATLLSTIAQYPSDTFGRADA